MTFSINTDYESVLFQNKPSLKMIRELEFLSLWLVDSVKNTVAYSDAYLDRIQKITGRKIELKPKATNFTNWWGELKNLDVERFLNSKETGQSLERRIDESAGIILTSIDDLHQLDSSKTYLFKSFDGVSGKGHKFVHQLKAQDFPLLAEVLHQRVIDFSCYIFPSGERIYYQNFISPQFSYKGSFFDLNNANNLLELDFVKERNHLDWKKYQTQVDQIEEFVRSRGKGGFSIDSYIHQEGIRTLCEINYRRTMGVTAFEIARIFPGKRFHFFTILKISKPYDEVLEWAEKEKILLLSHEQNFFYYFLISEDDKVQIKYKIQKLELVSGTSLSIDI